MLNDPPVDKLIDKMGNRYALCIVAAKRARQLIDQAAAQNISEANRQKPITTAAYELYEGKVTYTKY